MFKQVRSINSDLDCLAADLQALINATAGAAEDTVVTARKRLGALIHDGESAYNHLESGAVKTVKRANDAVRKHPFKALGMALGVGVAVGAIMYRKVR